MTEQSDQPERCPRCNNSGFVLVHNKQFKCFDLWHTSAPPESAVNMATDNLRSNPYEIAPAPASAPPPEPTTCVVCGGEKGYHTMGCPVADFSPPEPTRVRSSVIDSEGRIQPIAPAPIDDGSFWGASPATQSADPWLARNYPNLPAYVRNAVDRGTIYFEISKLCEAYATAQVSAAGNKSAKIIRQLAKEGIAYRREAIKLRAELERHRAAQENRDRAIEHGGYLATAAEAYLDAKNLYEAAEGAGEEPDPSEFNDFHRALQSAIYEFRKRAARAGEAKGEQGS